MFFTLVFSPCCVPPSTCHFLSSLLHLHIYIVIFLFLPFLVLSSLLYLPVCFSFSFSMICRLLCLLLSSFSICISFVFTLFCSSLSPSALFWLLFLLSPFNFRFFLFPVPLNSSSSLLFGSSSIFFIRFSTFYFLLFSPDTLAAFDLILFLFPSVTLFS